MEHSLIFFAVIIVSFGHWINADLRPSARICSSSRFSDQCSQLQRGATPVSCQQVQDSIDCAQRLRNRTADFGVFSAESALLLAALKYDGLTVIKELRHRDRLDHKSDFESVVVVRANHQNGIDGLKNSSYCHPGLFYDRHEKWSERFLKHFERFLVTPNCDQINLTATPAEIEVAALSGFFKQACRPGSWSNNPEEDMKLKAKYPSLCELCGEGSCEYSGTNRHVEALRCLINKGDVAYVSSQEAQVFFAHGSEHSSLNTEYKYLCPDGSTEPIIQLNKPCAWLRQPWPIIISSDSQNIDLSAKVKQWAHGTSAWETAFKEIITVDSFLPHDTTLQSPRDFFQEYREVPYSQALCATQSSWCTTSIGEKEKCEVIRVAGITSGIYPLIECHDPAPSTVTCLNDVSEGRADFMGIDSNYGFIARHPYNLTAALYAETENKKYASVIVAIHANSTIDRFENLRNTKACFAEFGSISAMAFINTGKNRGFFRKNQCKYGELLNEFFGPSCAPGALDLARNNEDQLDNLCALCRPSVHVEMQSFDAAIDGDIETIKSTERHTTTAMAREWNCKADQTNGYYGNQGALQCLRESGDVAILEAQYLNAHAQALQIDPSDYRIICANGSLAQYTGFDVDDNCALTIIVDGEVVVSRQSSKTGGIINALASFDKYFQNDPDFKMFNHFAGKTDLLFKDSTLGLSPRNEPSPGASVDNYKKLFQNLEECVNMGVSSSASFISIILATLLSIILTRI